jgi:hypothetical protein
MRYENGVGIIYCALAWLLLIDGRLFAYIGFAVILAIGCALKVWQLNGGGAARRIAAREITNVDVNTPANRIDVVFRSLASVTAERERERKDYVLRACALQDIATGPGQSYGEFKEAIQKATPPAPECPDCIAPCPICEGQGQHRCQGLHCGGLGYRELASHRCPARGCFGQTGQLRRGFYLGTLFGHRLSIGDWDCAACHNTGKIVTQQAECTVCHGTKLQECGNCHGLGKASTGFFLGALPPRPSDDGAPGAIPPRCPACEQRELLQEHETMRELTEKYCTPARPGVKVRI